MSCGVNTVIRNDAVAFIADTKKTNESHLAWLITKRRIAQLVWLKSQEDAPIKLFG